MCTTWDKKKGKRPKHYNDYILIYSWADKDEITKPGAGILIHETIKNNTEKCRYVSERTLHIKLITEHKQLLVVRVYSPEDCKPNAEKEAFFEELQDTLVKIPENDSLVLMGDFNARIGNDIIPGIEQRYTSGAYSNYKRIINEIKALVRRILTCLLFKNWPQRQTWRFIRTQSKKKEKQTK